MIVNVEISPHDERRGHDFDCSAEELEVRGFPGLSRWFRNVGDSVVIKSISEACDFEITAIEEEE